MRDVKRIVRWGALGVCLGCNANNPVYVPPMGPLEVGQSDGMNAATTTVALQFRQPTMDESATLQAESAKKTFGVPWLRADRVSVSLLYTITNLGDRRGRATLTVDGASEFASYDSAALRMAAMMADPMADEDELIALPLLAPTPLLLDPGERVSGTLREDDFLEAALDLDAIGRWMAVPESVLINRSAVNPIGLEMVPAGVVLPAFQQLIVNFSATTHMKLEFLVRVRDEKNQLLANSSGELFAPMPRAYTPPAMMMAPP